MILVTGGRASGKREYVMALGYSREDMADAEIDSRPVIYNVQDMAMRDPEGSMSLLDALCEKEVVITCEVGSGVIPLERAERDGREAAGRLAVRLAQKAEKVVRLVSGIPVVIKGSEET